MFCRWFAGGGAGGRASGGYRFTANAAAVVEQVRADYGGGYGTGGGPGGAARAELRRPIRRPQNIDGNIEALGSGGLKVKTESGQSVVVTTSPATKVQYTGKATVDFLRKPAWPSSSRPRSTRSTWSRRPSRN